MYHCWLLFFAVICLTLFPTSKENFVQNLLKKPKPRSNFVQYLTEMAAKHQILFLLDKNIDQMIKNNVFIRKVNRFVPSLSTSIDEAQNITMAGKHIGMKPRQTTLFVIFVDADEKSFNFQLNRSISFLEKLSKLNTLPKCLIVHFSQNAIINYQQLLKRVWKKQFLDVSILQIFEPEFSQDEKFFSHAKKSMIHQYNPYSDIYSVQKKWSKGSWFPDKCNNLQKQEIKILYELNLKMKVLFASTVAKQLNFTLKLIRAKKVGVDLSKNNVDFQIDPIRYHWNSRKVYRYQVSRATFLNNMKVIVPRIYQPDAPNFIAWRLIFSEHF